MWQEERFRDLRIVSVSSSSKKSGKTTLSTCLMRELPADFGLKVCADHHVPPITEDPEIISRPGTDTGALVRAGAEKVVWASSKTPEGLARILPRALELFPDRGVMIVESNSALQYITPDFAVFLMSAPFADFKPSAFLALPLADLVLLDLRWSLKGIPVDGLLDSLSERTPDARILYYSDERGQREALLETARMARRVVGQPLVASLLAADGSS